ncbi:MULTISPECIES: bifunctional diguanylate cyclase/phosphodiesterase [unclassified Polaromonas]|uniref:sensor domain-containing protein n=1 Tax=unclassified Polaromonas TaxID=2638319 RepID=UPI0018C9ADCF|nr:MULTISPECIES: bifunctional diguanylate cyclase/phosphodiesterase [unclassified Polaromonas]MBG6072312.1 diguanylate cyclase (GGDEF)-like protein/PAS domain S-box-containing protein [Polaromonas sp. CG_9.7]MBG6114257.1 diguanylate cyclase (GGDEF)-like protein/PAS domain S-box-containing protein [Polaromonas sp. CG_9.2]MDH6182785.1 diguanylate cyclase (GGDEF)-like protein/PAS domain S-box-containing protein [Polaromonas sp. CG_23.6]
MSLASQQATHLLAMAERVAQAGSWTMELKTPQWVSCSTKFSAIIGLLPERLITRDELTARFSPECRDRVGWLLQQCSRHGTGFDEEMQIDTPSSSKWVRIVCEAVHNKRGQVKSLQGMLQDISERKQAQQETLHPGMRLTTTLSTITDAFVMLDRQCCFTHVNQASEQLLRHASTELLGKEIWEVLVNDKNQRLRQELQRSIATGRQLEFEDFYPGLGKWLEVRAGPFAEGLVVYFRDVSKRRKSQEQLMLLETCVSRLNDIVLIAEAQPARKKVPYIVFVNHAFEQHTGYSRHEVLGQTPHRLLGSGAAQDEFERMARMLARKRQARSELLIYRKNGSCFWLELEIVQVADTADDLAHWVAVGRDITQRKVAADAIHQLAFYDPLTSLPNRLMLLNRLEQVMSQSVDQRRNGALMFIDVDKLKVLNDTLGHHKGDMLLQQVAERLAGCVDDTDTVARLGGDEFVVLLEDLGNNAIEATVKIRKLAETVLEHLREPFDLSGHQHYTTSSIGVTSLCGPHDSVSEVLKQADLAMYQAKTTGRNSVCFFDPEMQAAVNANAAVSSELHAGLRKKEFVLHYQPQVDRQGCVTGVEALLRWQHPRRGLVMPADFIPMAEDSGLILPLGQWALATACEQLAAWAHWPQAAGLSIAVNVSVRQFRHPDFVDQVMAEIRRTGVKPERLKLELTETLLADGIDITLARMGTLKALGVTLALDDFGMGYSSLSVLKRLPLDQLKIDKSFVAEVLTDRTDAAISRTIITLAHSLNLEVVAEGVETQAQQDFLVAQGCDQFQGFLFSQPLPLVELEAYLMEPGTQRKTLAAPLLSG